MLPLYNIKRQSRATLGHVLPKSPTRIIILLVALLSLGACVSVANTYSLPSSSTQFNYVLSKSPNWVAGKADWIWPGHPHFGEAENIESLRYAPWPGSFATPKLRRPKQNGGELMTWNGNGFNRTNVDEVVPALMMLHIFSMPNEASRRRRALIRSIHPINSIPEGYRHLVEIKFVLGYDEFNDGMSVEDRERVEMEEREMMVEEREFGDLIRLKGLHHGENMNQGKTIEWMRWVGRDGGREAQWVMKCDDDTFPILPNLLPILTTLDPSKPTYIGTSLGHHSGYMYYFEGMMYGFNWGVIKTMAKAELGNDVIHRNFDEDAYTGLLMYNLPSKPDHPLAKSPQTNPHPMDPTNGTPLIPASPDPRTGLIRVNLGNQMGSFDRWWIAGPGRAVVWHNLKTNESYREAYNYALRGFKRIGREFMWIPTRRFWPLATGESIRHKKTDRWGLLK